MAQRFGLYQDLTVEENMVFYADLFGIVGAERDELDRAAAAHDPHGAVPRAPGGQASGGMKQKLALMCTLLHRPADSVPGRADQRRGSGFAPRFLGDPVSTAEGRHHHLHDHGLPGRSRALQSRGPDAQGQADPLRRAGGDEARDRRRRPGRRLHQDDPCGGRSGARHERRLPSRSTTW